MTDPLDIDTESSSSFSLLASCTEGCGWIAALIAVFSFGSFGVPIRKTSSVNVDPLVMQSYKTLVCFATSWCVLLLGEEIKWSNYGIASGIFWVLGATCGVYGIREAGLAVAVGTWSSINVLTSFFFGIIIFQEGVKNFASTCLAFLLLICGLVGMSRYSAATGSPSSTVPTVEREGVPIGSSSLRGRQHNMMASPPPPSGSTVLHVILPQVKALKRVGSVGETDAKHMTSLEMEALIAANNDEFLIMGDADTKDGTRKDNVVLFQGRISMTKRQLGILCAVINGAWGGMNLIPMHYAAQNAGLSGAGYLISYAGGSLIVNTALWVFLYFYHLYHKKGNFYEALDSLPKWHLDTLWLPGLLAGLLYSTGNFGTMLAVTYLGQGTGGSFCQMQLFVSGLWGVFYFREIKGTATVIKWFLSAAIAVTGIIWLSYEHQGGTAMH